MSKEYTLDDLNNIKPTPHFQYNCVDAYEDFSNDMISFITEHLSKEKWDLWNTQFDTRLQKLEDVLYSGILWGINQSQKEEDIKWCEIVSKIIISKIKKTFDNTNMEKSVGNVLIGILNDSLFVDYITFDCINCDKDSGDNSGNSLCPECEDSDEYSGDSWEDSE